MKLQSGSNSDFVVIIVLEVLRTNQPKFLPEEFPSRVPRDCWFLRWFRLMNSCSLKAKYCVSSENCALSLLESPINESTNCCWKQISCCSLFLLLLVLSVSAFLQLMIFGFFMSSWVLDFYGFLLDFFIALLPSFSLRFLDASMFPFFPVSL